MDSLRLNHLIIILLTDSLFEQYHNIMILFGTVLLHKQLNYKWLYYFLVNNKVIILCSKLKAKNPDVFPNIAKNIRVL